jgi:hypothetical protein
MEQVKAIEDSSAQIKDVYVANVAIMCGINDDQD